MPGGQKRRNCFQTLLVDKWPLVMLMEFLDQGGSIFPKCKHLNSPQSLGFSVSYSYSSPSAFLSSSPPASSSLYPSLSSLFLPLPLSVNKYMRSFKTQKCLGPPGLAECPRQPGSKSEPWKCGIFPGVSANQDQVVRHQRREGIK